MEGRHVAFMFYAICVDIPSLLPTFTQYAGRKERRKEGKKEGKKEGSKKRRKKEWRTAT